jgi:hypothetical protein
MIAHEALKPIAVEPVPEPALLDETLPPYILPLKLNYLSGIPESRGSIELETFKIFISDNVVRRIMAATNSYTKKCYGFMP